MQEVDFKKNELRMKRGKKKCKIVLRRNPFCGWFEWSLHCNWTISGVQEKPLHVG